MLEQKLLTVSDVAAILQYSPNKVYKLISEKHLKRASIPGSREIRILPTEMDRFLLSIQPAETEHPPQTAPTQAVNTAIRSRAVTRDFFELGRRNAH